MNLTLALEDARKVEQARVAWLTASRDTELDRWQELYDLAVPRPSADDGGGHGHAVPAVDLPDLERRWAA